MPASSMSSLTSWGAYLIASAALVLALNPMLSGTAAGSRSAADWRNLDGVRSVLDALRPGVTATISYGIQTSGDPVHLSGHLITCSDGQHLLALQTRWALPTVTLAPSVEYFVWLDGTTVEVISAG
jgi:hypothetical protein